MASQLTTVLAIEEQKLLACIHCGLCLEACPTYVATGDENDSPRGRIYLMRAVAEGRLAIDSPSFARHLDRCLGCRACEPVCPAGVEYGQLLEAGRAEIFKATGQRRSVGYKLLRLALRHVWLQPKRLRFTFVCSRVARDAGLVRWLLKSKLPRLISQRFEFAFALLESSAPGTTAAPRGAVKVDAGPTSSVLLFKGCVTEGLFARVNRATARVLAVNGFAGSAPKEQVCCGALHAHAGDLEGARTLARQNIEVFGDSSGPIITNAGGCGAMLASYGQLLVDDELVAARAAAFSARVRDISQQLQTAAVKEGAALGETTVTYDASCHLINGQHAGEAPLQMLRAIPYLQVVSLEGSEHCCGGAGVYNLLEPELSRQVLDEKLSHIKQTGAQLLATGNPGCQMQIGAGARLAGAGLKLCHPVELLDESYRRAGFYERSNE
jgi:glycolate oxidase iron-sulfur subunit